MNSKSAKLKRHNSKKTRSKKSYRRRTRCLKSRKDKSKRKRRIMKGGDYGLSPDDTTEITTKVIEFIKYENPQKAPVGVPDISHLRNPKINDQEMDAEHYFVRESDQDNLDTLALMSVDDKEQRRLMDIDRLVLNLKNRYKDKYTYNDIYPVVKEKFDYLVNEKEKMIN